MSSIKTYHISESSKASETTYIPSDDFDLSHYSFMRLDNYSLEIANRGINRVNIICLESDGETLFSVNLKNTVQRVPIWINLKKLEQNYITIVFKDQKGNNVDLKNFNFDLSFC